MAQPYPISRESREEAIFFGDGGAVYGPFALKIFDIDDVEVWTKADGGTWTIAAPTVAKVDPSAAFDEFTITFAAVVPLTTKIKVLSARVHERSAGIAAGTKLSPDALEKELTKQGTILQELRRDIERAALSEFGVEGYRIADDLADGDVLMKSNGRLIKGANALLIAQAEGFAEAAALSADEAAADAAAAAASAAAISIRNVADRAAMLSLSTAGSPLAIVKDEARGGDYDWLPGDQSALVTADPGAIAVVPPTATPSGAGGVWLWRKLPRFDPRRAGAIGALGDGSEDIVGGLPCPDDVVAVQRAMAWAAAEGAILEIDRPYRLGHTLRDENLLSLIGPCQLQTNSGQYMEWLPDGWLYPCMFSRSGSIITNLITSTDAGSIQENMRFINPQVDMSGYNPFRYIGQLVSGDGLGTYNAAPATRVQVGAPLSGDAVPTGRGNFTFYNYIVEIVHGTGVGQNAFIKGYDEATGRFTLNELWPITPDNTSIIRMGSNDNPFGLNVSNCRIEGGRIRNVPLGLLWAGGKAINFENGADDCHVSDVFAQNIEGIAFFAQGHDGVSANGRPRFAKRISFDNCTAVDAGALLGSLAGSSTTDPDGDFEDNLISFTRMWGERVGHYPGRIMNSDQQKSGAIVLAEAGPTLIRDVHIDNAGWNPVYPSDYPARNGYGMTGPIGAVILGWGYGIDIDNVRYYGNADNLTQWQRCRAIGDDASRTPSAGVIQNVFRIDVRNLYHHGTLTSEAALPEAERRKGFVCSLNPWVGDVYPGNSFLPVNSEVRITYRRIRINSDIDLLPAHLAPYNGIIFEDVRDWLTSKTIVGPVTAQQLYAGGNSVADYLTYIEPLKSAVIGDDVVLDIIPPTAKGFIEFYVSPGQPAATGVAGRFFYCIESAPQAEPLGIGANVSYGTTALTNGAVDGVDTDINFVAVIGKLQLKNMTGASRGWSWRFS